MQKRLKHFISSLPKAPSVALIYLIKLYQKFSPAFGQRCRYYPSCSQYAIDALHSYGLIKGIALAIWRILRCQPMCEGGFDPVHCKKPNPLSEK